MYFRRLDLSDQQSIRAFAAEQAQQLEKHKKLLDVLINNAGLVGRMGDWVE